jgi:hypothetical protein
MATIQLTTTNYNGESGVVYFYPCNSGSTPSNLGPQTFPFEIVDTENYEGTYQVLFTGLTSGNNQICYTQVPCSGCTRPTGLTTTELFFRFTYSDGPNNGEENTFYTYTALDVCNVIDDYNNNLGFFSASLTSQIGPDNTAYATDILADCSTISDGIYVLVENGTYVIREVINGILDPTVIDCYVAPTPTATPTATPTSTPEPATDTPTPTPTATPTATPTPTPEPLTDTPTPTPTAMAAVGCNSTINGTYVPSGSTIQTHNLDFSTLTNGSTIVVSYDAYDRPDRFNIYEDGLLIVNSGWVGSDSTYSGPWGDPGSLGNSTGQFDFIFDNTKTYELRVDVGSANPSNVLQDSWDVTLTCNEPIVPTATPTPTPTPTALSGCNSTISDTYSFSGSTLQSHLIDFSELPSGHIVTISYEAYDRPNRFNIYADSSLVGNSGWVGSDNSYDGPWGNAGSLGNSTGQFTFTYDHTKTYELRVDVANANPSNILDDAWDVTIYCAAPATATPTPTPIAATATPTPTPTALPMVWNLYHPCDSTTPADQVIEYTPNFLGGEIIKASNGLCYTVVVTGYSLQTPMTVISEHSTCEDCSPSATATPTPTPPASTATPTPTPLPATATPTPTPEPPTATPTPTPEPPTATPTSTPAPPTATPTVTPTPCPSAGQKVGEFCVDYTLYHTYADGSCGTYDVAYENNSLACGYVAPTATPTATPTVTPTPCPVYGTLLYDYCEDYPTYSRIGVYANGSCGTYTEIIMFNDPTCGYVAPPTSTPTPTATPTPTPTPTPEPASVYTYFGSGYGGSTAAACNDAGINNRTLYSDCDGGTFNVGCYVYVDTFPNPLTGSTNVFMNGASWDINPISGQVQAYSTEQC